MTAHPDAAIPDPAPANAPSARRSRGQRGPTRRDLLAGAAGALAFGMPTIVPGRALGLEPGTPAASARITLGVIGIGPRCRYVLGAMLPLPDVQCLAIADVQRSRREAGKALVDTHYGTADCRLHRDFRELLARPDIDAVLVATGDRWHGPASILAAEAGKDVYSEKPCGISIDICQQLADTFQRTGRIFQAGTQRRSVPNFIDAVRLATSGRLGKLHTLHASAYKPVLANDWLPAQPTPDPETCDWNMWLGPAPWRPFNQQYVDGKWRGYHDFDSGAKLLDWGAHTVDLCQWAGGFDGTTPVEFDPRPTAPLPLRKRREAGDRLPPRSIRRPGAQLEHQARHLPGEVRRRRRLGGDRRRRRHRSLRRGAATGDRRGDAEGCRHRRRPPRTQLLRLREVAAAGRLQRRRDAEESRRLPCRGDRLDARPSAPLRSRRGTIPHSHGPARSRSRRPARPAAT
jgi:hypothetical protein